MKRLMNLWGKGASAEDQPKDETEEEKAAREKAEKEAADKKAAEEAAAAEASDDDDEEEEEEEEEDEATKAAAAAVPAKVRASIIRAERSRIHAIVDGGGQARVQTSLQLALGTNLSPKAALAIVRTAGPAASAPPAGGRLGLQGDMSARRQPQLGAAGGGGAASDIDRFASSIASFAARPGADRD